MIILKDDILVHVDSSTDIIEHYCNGQIQSFVEEELRGEIWIIQNHK